MNLLQLGHFGRVREQLTGITKSLGLNENESTTQQNRWGARGESPADGSASPNRRPSKTREV